MKSLVRVSVPLQGLVSEVTVPEPCAYCGAAVGPGRGHEWVHKSTYPLKAWGRTSKYGQLALANVTSGGRQLEGTAVLRAHYCPEHVSGIPLLDHSRVGGAWAGALLGVVAGGLWLWGVASRVDSLLNGLIMVGFIGFFGFGIGLLIGDRVLPAVLGALSSKYRDYSAGSGNYGLVVTEVRTDGGEPGCGPITYHLRIGFHNPETARRFLEANPSAVIEKGEGLLGPVPRG